MRFGWRERFRPLFWMQVLIVLVVLGVASAIVRPRMSRGAALPPDQADHLLVGRLRMLRSAILSYAMDHCGQVPSGDSRTVQRQLLEYTDLMGRPSPVRHGPFVFGPYLRELPPLTVGTRAGFRRITVTGYGPPDASSGWIYDPPSGMIRANTQPGEWDPDGIAYGSY